MTVSPSVGKDGVYDVRSRLAEPTTTMREEDFDDDMRARQEGGHERRKKIGNMKLPDTFDMWTGKRRAAIREATNAETQIQ